MSAQPQRNRVFLGNWLTDEWETAKEIGERVGMSSEVVYDACSVGASRGLLDRRDVSVHGLLVAEFRRPQLTSGVARSEPFTAAESRAIRKVLADQTDVRLSVPANPRFGQDSAAAILVKVLENSGLVIGTQTARSRFE